MSRNLSRLERVDALVAQARALPGLRKTHCTLGAVATAAGLPGGRFPSPMHGGLILWRLNQMLSPERAQGYARQVASYHDQGLADESWATLREALGYGLAPANAEHQFPAPQRPRRSAA